MISKTLKAGIFTIAVASFSLVGAQEKLEAKQEKPQAKKDKSEKMFQYLDTNSDDVITLEEYQRTSLNNETKREQLGKKFEEFDADSNGKLDRQEFKVAYEAERKSNQLKRIKNRAPNNKL